MGEAAEGRLLLSMAVPMILSMLVQALYNVVDSIYVARVSEDCLSALSLAFPAQNIMIGLATGTGVGVSSLASRALGKGDGAEARRVTCVAFDRRDEFAPVKNASGKDSPETCRAALRAKWRRQLEGELHIAVPIDIPLEIDPLYMYDGGDILKNGLLLKRD